MEINTGLTIEDFEAFLLILMRITSFMVAAPFFNTSNTPMRFKLGLGIFLSILIQMAMPLTVPAYSNAIEYAFLIIKESVAGILIGFSANISISAIQFTGRMIDMEIGMSMATIFDPTTRTQASLTGGLYNYLILMMLVVTDMHHFLLRALVDSFQVIPIGGIYMADTHDRVLEFFSSYFSIGFRLVLPVFAATLIISIILGILSKVAPQMNMMAVGMQIKVLAGLGIIFLTAGLLPSMADYIFENMQSMVISIIKGMME